MSITPTPIPITMPAIAPADVELDGGCVDGAPDVLEEVDVADCTKDVASNVRWAAVGEAEVKDW